MHSISMLLGNQANYLLELFGYQPDIDTFDNIVVTKISGTYLNHGVWIGEPCNGLKLFGVFSIFIIAFPGSIKSKLWFIPLGILFLHFFNVLRIGTLTIIAANNPLVLNFNHNITFQIVIYSMIILLWHIWIKQFSGLKTLSKQEIKD